MKYVMTIACLLCALCARAAASPQANISAVLATHPSLEVLTQVLEENGDLMPYDDPAWLSVLDYVVRQSELPQYSHPNLCLGELNDPLGAALMQFSTREYPASMPRSEREIIVFGDTLTYNDRLRLIVSWSQINQQGVMPSELSPDPIVDIVTTCSSINAPMGAQLWQAIYGQEYCALLTPEIVSTSFSDGPDSIGRALFKALSRCWSAEEAVAWGLPILFELVGDRRYFDSETIDNIEGVVVANLAKREVKIFLLHNWLIKSDTKNFLSSDKKYQSFLKEVEGDMAFLFWLSELQYRDKPVKNWDRYCNLTDGLLAEEINNKLKPHGLTCGLKK